MIERPYVHKVTKNEDPYYQHEAKMLEKINNALGDLELTEVEERTWLWLASNDESTVRNILNVVDRLRR